MKWLCEKFREHLISHKAEVEWAPNSSDQNPPLGFPLRQHLPGQPLHHCCIEGSHHRKDSRDHLGGTCMHYQQISMSHSTVL